MEIEVNDFVEEDIVLEDEEFQKRAGKRNVIKIMD